MKGSDISQTIQAHELFASRFDYPVHVGITEAGPSWQGIIKSAVGIGAILNKGIGDTIRVSVTGDPKEQVKVGWEILKALQLRQKGVTLISCPTCGRTQVDLIGLTHKVETLLVDVQAPLKVAVMGCIVNGPGEARFADIGLCGGKGQAMIIKKGQPVATVPETQALPRFLEEIQIVLQEKGYIEDVNRIKSIAGSI